MIRVFKLPTCEKMYELHRGTSPCAIFSISFNDDSSKLAISSSKGTVHIFNLSQKLNEEKNSDKKSSWRKSISSQFYRFIDQLSTRSHNDEKDHIRSFARIRIKSEKIGKKVLPNTITFLNNSTNDRVSTEKENHVAVCTENAKYFQFVVKESGKTFPIRAEDVFF